MKVKDDEEAGRALDEPRTEGAADEKLIAEAERETVEEEGREVTVEEAEMGIEAGREDEVGRIEPNMAVPDREDDLEARLIADDDDDAVERGWDEDGDAMDLETDAISALEEGGAEDGREEDEEETEVGLWVDEVKEDDELDVRDGGAS